MTKPFSTVGGSKQGEGRVDGGNPKHDLSRKIGYFEWPFHEK